MWFGETGKVGARQLGDKKGCRPLLVCVQKMRCACGRATCLSLPGFQKIVLTESREDEKLFFCGFKEKIEEQMMVKAVL